MIEVLNKGNASILYTDDSPEGGITRLVAPNDGGDFERMRSISIPEVQQQLQDYCGLMLTEQEARDAVGDRNIHIEYRG